MVEDITGDAGFPHERAAVGGDMIKGTVLTTSSGILCWRVVLCFDVVASYDGLIAMQGDTCCAGGQRLAVSLYADHDRQAEAGVLGGELRTGRVVLQPRPHHQHCHLG